MHDTAYHIGTLAMNLYADLGSASVLEIGSHAVNGSLRDNALPTTRYVGIDLEEGPGVDIVIEAGAKLPVEQDSFDLVIASSVFEHDPSFWLTFLEMCRATKVGGYIYVNAPSNGMVHRYPQDHWRFYPDSGLALQKWAVAQGQHVTLMESFTAEREADIWNDFVAVFRKGPITNLLPSTFLYEHVPCVNVRTWKSNDIKNQRDEPQDTVLLREARQSIVELTAETARRNELKGAADQQAAEARTSIEQLGEQVAVLQSQVMQHQREGELLQARLRSAESELKEQREDARNSLAQLRQENLLVVEELASKVGRLNLELEQAKTQLERETDRLKAAHERSARIQNEVDEARAGARALEEKDRVRIGELATITVRLQQQEHRNSELERQLAWSAAVRRCIAGQPAWWVLMPRAWREERLKRRLLRASLFDHHTYLKLYPDVAEAGLDALDHYERHGFAEGRSDGLS
jgi:hypothetical protein